MKWPEQRARFQTVMDEAFGAEPAPIARVVAHAIKLRDDIRAKHEARRGGPGNERWRSACLYISMGVAGALQRAGVRLGDRVGLWMKKTPACIQAALGVLASGVAYVRLNPRAPWRRCRTIASNCEVSALIADLPRLAALADLLEGLELRTVLVHALARVAEEAIERSACVYSAPWRRTHPAGGSPAGGVRSIRLGS